MTIETSLEGKKIVKQNSNICVRICVINRLFLAVFVCKIPTCLGLKQQSWLLLLASFSQSVLNASFTTVYDSVLTGQ